MPLAKAKSHNADVIIIGGGFYGASLALVLRQYYKKILILEKENELLTQASYINQATVHNGYHYPRSYMTALRSKVNFPRFLKDYSKAIFTNYDRIYAVAQNNSKISAKQFKMFCDRIDTPITPATQEVQNLFDPAMIEAVFLTQEYAFNADILRDVLKERLAQAKIAVIFNAAVSKISEQNENLAVVLESGDKFTAKQVISCTYAATNTILVQSGLQPLPMKREMTEVALIKVPPVLEKLGITIIDGPFFATMPFPATPFHSFTHVRYTPQKTFDQAENGAEYKPKTNFQFMIRDAARYLPVLKEARYDSSLFTTKAVLPQNERDDGRPILYRKDYGFKNFSVVLGGKIDNIYDIFAAMGL